MSFIEAVAEKGDSKISRLAAKLIHLCLFSVRAVKH